MRFDIIFLAHCYNELFENTNHYLYFIKELKRYVNHGSFIVLIEDEARHSVNAILADIKYGLNAIINDKQKYATFVKKHNKVYAPCIDILTPLDKTIPSLLYEIYNNGQIFTDQSYLLQYIAIYKYVL